MELAVDASMKKVPDAEMDGLIDRMGRADENFDVKAFSHLRKMRKHKFGPLRAWPN